MDLLDFESEDLYFNDPIDAEAEALVNEAAETYGDESCEALLLRAYFLEPGHLSVLVALYRFYYYQHRLHDTLKVAERTLEVSARQLGVQDYPWEKLELKHINWNAPRAMTRLRFYLLALKGTGYLKLRLGDAQGGLAMLRKVESLDSQDRLGAGELANVASRRFTVSESDKVRAIHA